MEWVGGLWEAHPDITHEDLETAIASDNFDNPLVQRMITAVFLDRKRAGLITDETAEAFTTREVTHFQQFTNTAN
jgi:hypothetical protein